MDINKYSFTLSLHEHERWLKLKLLKILKM